MGRSFKAPLFAYVLLAPQLLITFVFFFWPAIEALRQSMFQGDPFGLHSHFVGWDNFYSLLQSKSYLKSIAITTLFSVLVTTLTVSAGLLFAVLVTRVTKGKAWYKAFMLWPYAVAPAVAGMLWRFLFNPAVGWVPFVLQHFGIEWNYIIHPYQAMTVVVLASSWQQFSYNFLFFFAALSAIPRSLLEAANLDGASSWQRFWHVTFPLLSPTTFFLLVINIIYAFFDTFGVIQVMTEGGPAGSTATLVYKVYTDGFVGLDLGSSAAQSVVLMFIVILLTVIQFRYIEKKVHY